jgi:hypothetical protein
MTILTVLRAAQVGSTICRIMLTFAITPLVYVPGTALAHGIPVKLAVPRAARWWANTLREVFRSTMRH